ncbi:hypothetical protein FQR65_LT19915 [Abscondita terminalis]|nr:hypothetical protein FQR65_LT19915 [Abscondita terminalis]
MLLETDDYPKSHPYILIRLCTILMPFCSDTLYDESIVPLSMEADVLYQKVLFGTGQIQTAASMHSTAIEARNHRQKAHVKTLVLGHYSTRYANLNAFKEEAETVFDTVELAEDGKVKKKGIFTMFPINPPTPEDRGLDATGHADIFDGIQCKGACYFQDALENSFLGTQLSR